ncbi:hypothetical protein FQN51_002221 [Onygenales sp. PD_10]|nr:hypothetical protein FQN51_002221 [Onygenales sp. PD_10]
MAHNTNYYTPPGNYHFLSSLLSDIDMIALKFQGYSTIAGVVLLKNWMKWIDRMPPHRKTERGYPVDIAPYKAIYYKDFKATARKEGTWRMYGASGQEVWAGIPEC